MRIAAAAKGMDLESIIADRYEESRALLIVETDDLSVVAAYQNEDADGTFMGKKIIEYGCEAVVCGIMQKNGFEILANEGVSRYHGAGLKVREGITGSLYNRLPLIPDFEGGTGCGSEDGKECNETHREHE